MPVFDKSTASSWPKSVPWVKMGFATWAQPLRVYSKTGVSTWIEVWPLQPGSPSAPALALPYRNDRIEMDLSWTAAPGSGTTATPIAAAGYNVIVFINGAQYSSFSVAGTSITLTNSSAGFQSAAGQSVRFTVQAYGASGVTGPLVSSATSTIPQLPAPPAITSFAPSLSGGDLSYTFNHVGGNRLQGFDVRVNGAQYFYGAATSVSANGHPWVGASVNGGAFTVDVYAYGPGGYSPVTHFEGVIPGDVVFTGTRMYTGSPGSVVSELRGTGVLGAGSTAYQLYWNQEGGAFNYYGNVGAGFISLPASTIGTALVRYRWVGIPINALGTGRTCVSPFVRRIANPQFVDPLDTQTWFNGGFGAPGNTVLQGYDSGSGTFYYGYVFYGNAFRDQMNDSYLGYHLNFNYVLSNVGLARANDSSPSAENVFLWIHTAGSRAEVTNAIAGNIYSGDVGPGEGLFAGVPLDWIRYLVDQTNGWKGIAVYDSSHGATNVHNMRFLAAHFGVGSVESFQFRVYHDG